MQVEIKVPTVPHFKGPVNGKVEPCQLKYASTFTIQTSLLYIGYSLHESDFVDSQLLPTVCIYSVYSNDQAVTTS